MNIEPSSLVVRHLTPDPFRQPIHTLIILSDGYNDAHTAKTAINVIRYKPEEVVAVLDRKVRRVAKTGLAWAGRFPWWARWPMLRRATPC